jgi:glutamine amidotransferase
MVLIIDYNIGNLLSVQNMFKYLGVSSRISNSIEDIRNSDKLVLPGVGHFKTGMENLFQSNLLETLSEEVLIKKKPIFGICVGMQLFSSEGHEEEITQGFGWVKGSVKKIKLNNKDLKLPHMGWNEVNIIKKNNLFVDIKNLSHFYFVHSYAFEAENIDDVICTTDYEQNIVAAILKDNIFGTQFHPEKSQDNGVKLLSNFLSWDL